MATRDELIAQARRENPSTKMTDDEIATFLAKADPNLAASLKPAPTTGPVSAFAQGVGRGITSVVETGADAVRGVVEHVTGIPGALSYLPGGLAVPETSGPPLADQFQDPRKLSGASYVSGMVGEQVGGAATMFGPAAMIAKLRGVGMAGLAAMETALATGAGVGAAAGGAVGGPIGELLGALTASLGVSGALAAIRAMRTAPTGAKALREGGEAVSGALTPSVDRSIDTATKQARTVPGMPTPNLAQASGGAPGPVAIGQRAMARPGGYERATAAQEQAQAASQAQLTTVRQGERAVGDPAATQDVVRQSMAVEDTATEAATAAGVLEIQTQAQAAMGPVNRAVSLARADAEQALGGAQFAGPEAAGQTIMQRIAARRDDLEESMRGLYAPVDRANPTIDTSTLAGAVADVQERMARTVAPDNFPPVLRNILDRAVDAETGAPRTSVSWAELQEWRSELVSAARNLRRSATPNEKALGNLTEARAGIDATLDETLGRDAGSLGSLYREANAARLDIAQRFDQGVVGLLQQGGARGEEMKVSLEKVAGKFWNGGFREARDFRAAVGDDVLARQALRDHAVGDFVQSVFRDGVLNSQAARNWLRTHQPALSEFPEIAQEIGGMARSVRRYDDVASFAGGAASGIKQWETQMTALRQKAPTVAQQVSDRRALTAYVGADADKAIETILSGTNPEKKMMEIVRRATGDDAAMRGLKSSFWDQMVPTTKGSPKLGALSVMLDPDAGITFLEKHRATARLLYTPEHLGTVETTLRALAPQTSFGVPVRPGLAGVSPAEGYVAHQLAEVAHGFGRRTIAGLAGGYMYGQSLKSTVIGGAVGLVSDVVARNWTATRRALHDDQLGRLFEAAFFDPQAARAIRDLYQSSLRPNQSWLPRWTERVTKTVLPHLDGPMMVPGLGPVTTTVPRVRGHLAAAPSVMGREEPAPAAR